MNYFDYKNGALYCEEVPVENIVRATGSPVYIYSYRTIERHYKVFDNAFKGVPHIICYSCKANSNIAILRAIGRLGGGVDIVSGGELYRSSAAYIPNDKIVFSGVGKTEEEIVAAIRSNILMINVESEEELSTIARIASKMKKHVPLSIRVNPEIDPKTHPYITTGLKKNKFGVMREDAMKLYDRIKAHKYLMPVGISSHIGSQILELGPFKEAVCSLREMVKQLKEKGITLKFIDIGGGLGITYKDELPPHPDDYARIIEEELKGTELTLILEPGRVIVGNSGIFVTKLLYIKKVPGKTFYIVDGAMNDLVRPSLYGAFHEIVSVRYNDAKKINVDVVGPVCESGDFLAKDRDMPLVESGELLAVLSAGAYGFSMSSNYNSRRRVAEVLVRDAEFNVIKSRETLKDLIKGEKIPSFMEV
ncbi:MAG TPA: diaminopimelate decarboxylase [Syntrophorhabdaceae bacterium]|jgi:diaminopimelate decarboxylase|nr:diaminopimelate decarboxylase [Syntrophorhabdaceae bacterium]MDI9560000.1 diaminopimelate decarboxylase [Pseudomonadota bacterium]MBP8699455.1 diaminopimelate decarboxylase [Syntrophorhabdaceae bacterium]MBV6506112.1 Diaminopimelate decarboxylase [Syntrophorhabdaceae bacterium]HNQ64141.1 diaminopimelate decarboxylase [Syntrophorhabdaceae bacterium]